MVGHDAGYQHKGQREEEEGEKGALCATALHHLTKDTIDEDAAVKSTDHLYGGHNKHGTINACKPHQCLINKVGHIHKEGQQGVAKHGVARVPITYH